MLCRTKLRCIELTDHGPRLPRVAKFQAEPDSATAPNRTPSDECAPSGELTLFVNNPGVLAQLKVGASYWLDLTPVLEG